MMRAPTIAGNIPGADFILGHTPGSVTIRAEVAFVLVKDHCISQRHFCRRAQRKVAVIVRRVASETADLRRVRNEFLDIDLAGLNSLNKTFVGVATLAVIGVGVTRIAESSVTRSLVLTPHPAHRELSLGTVTIDATLGQNASLRIGNLKIRQDRIENYRERCPKMLSLSSSSLPHARLIFH